MAPSLCLDSEGDVLYSWRGELFPKTQGISNLSAGDFGILHKVYKEASTSLGLSYEEISDKVKSGEKIIWEKPVT